MAKWQRRRPDTGPDEASKPLIFAYVERHAPSKGLVEHHSQAIHVGTAVVGLPHQALGRHVDRRAKDAPCCGGVVELGWILQLGDAKIDHLHDLAVGSAVEEDVGRLDVPVDDARRVGCGQRVADRGEDLRTTYGGQAPFLAHLIGQRASLQELHDQESQPDAGHAGVQHDHGIGVSEPGGRDPFLPELLPLPVGVDTGLRAQDLDRDRTAVLEVDAAVDRGESTATDLNLQLVAVVQGGAGQHIGQGREDPVGVAPGRHQLGVLARELLVFVHELAAQARQPELVVDAGEHFLGVERLGHEVDATGAEPAHLVAHVVEGAQEDDGDLLGAGVALQLLAHLVAVHIGHVHVE